MAKLRWKVFLVGTLAAGLCLAAIQAREPRRAAAGNKPDLKSLVFVANRDSNDVAIIDVRTDQIIERFPVGGAPHMTIVAASGLAYTTGSASGDITIFDTKTFSMVGRLSVGALGPEHGTVSPDGRWLYVADVEGNAVSIINLKTHRLARVIEGLSHPHNIAFAPDGRAYIAQAGSYDVLAVDPRTFEITTRVPAGKSAAVASLRPPQIKGVNNLAFVGDTLFATNQDGGQLAVISSKEDRLLKAIPMGREPWEPYPTPDGRKVLVPNLGDRNLSILDAVSHQVLATLPTGNEVTGVVVTPDSRKAYVVRRGDDRVSVIDLGALKVRAEVPVGAGPEVATLIADGSKVYVASAVANTVSVIDTLSDRVIRTIGPVGRYPWALTSFGGYNYCH